MNPQDPRAAGAAYLYMKQRWNDQCEKALECLLACEYSETKARDLIAKVHQALPEATAFDMVQIICSQKSEPAKPIKWFNVGFGLTAGNAAADFMVIAIALVLFAIGAAIFLACQHA